LRKAFCEYGKPTTIQADHGSLFYENQCKSPFPTPLHLWLLGLGIKLTWARIYRPTDQARVERSHQVMHNQIRQTSAFKSWSEFSATVTQRREMLNNHISNLKDGKSLMEQYPQAKHSGRYYYPLNEVDCFSHELIFQFLSEINSSTGKQKEWFRKVSSAKTISIGKQVYYLTNAKPKSELRITFNTSENNSNLIFYDDKELIAQLPIKGIYYNDLVDAVFLNTLNLHQLEIPFKGNIHQFNHVFEHPF
jgi:hypothetical protein